MNKEITKKSVFLETYGCQMNEYDTQLVRAILAKAEYAFVPTESEADIIMLNTCAIRENAHRKVYGRIHDIRHRRKGAPVMIGLLGCMVTNLRKELLEDKGLNIDFIAGPDSYKRLPQLIEEALLGTSHMPQDTRQQIFDVTLSEFETYSDIYPQREKGVNAWIAVSRGCNNFCTFCVVPYTRERSRSPENILEEVKRVADEGFKQVTLLGQNVNSYQHEGSDFADLIEKVSRVNGIERIRFTSPHPKDFPEKLLKTIAANPKACKHVHLPVQAGNSRVLELMNRTYTREEFLQLTDKVRTLIPGAGLTTDVIVGFPTETREEFEDTLSLMRQVEFDSAFTFKYSERKGTIASHKHKDDVPEEEKTERITRLVELQRNISLKRNRLRIGSTVEVLIEEKGLKNTPDDCQGRTDENQLVIFTAPSAAAGDMVKVNISAASPYALKGHALP